jgi:hypothetical protein
VELGESIAVTLFIDRDEEHSENTCPWHQKKKASAKPMDPQEGDEDATGSMPDNSGKKLGTNLTSARSPAPAGEKVLVYYAQGAVLKYPAGRKTKVIRVYEETVDEEEYDLQFAPHHLVPGNESLKGSSVVAFLGDDTVIENFKQNGKPSSHIKKDMSVGYDVNTAKNGEWLPSPYALSMSNEWPAAEGLKALRKREGDDVALETEAFKMAYAASAIGVGKKQFHMRHADYSAKVREILDAMGAKVKLLATKLCPLAKQTAEDKKFEPPAALGARIDTLSGKLRSLVRGDPPTGWRNPLFTDELSAQYYSDYKGRQKKMPNLKVM